MLQSIFQVWWLHVVHDYVPVHHWIPRMVFFLSLAPSPTLIRTEIGGWKYFLIELCHMPYPSMCVYLFFLILNFFMERHVTWTKKTCKELLFWFRCCRRDPFLLLKHFGNSLLFIVVVVVARGSWLVACDCSEANNNMSIINRNDVRIFFLWWHNQNGNHP